MENNEVKSESLQDSENVEVTGFKYSKFSPFRKDIINNNRYPKPPNESVLRNYNPGPRRNLSKSNQIKHLVCNNCGIQGHSFINCKNPVYSYGLIILTQDNTKLLVIQRRDSFGYISLINNQWLPDNCLHGAAKDITQIEYEKVVCFDFQGLWKDVMGDKRMAKNTSVMSLCKSNFEKNNIKSIVKELDSQTLRMETEWGFPKGRIKKKEKWLECAKREAFEETQISESFIDIISDVPFMENIKGFDDRMYINIYYVARLNTSFDNINLNPEKSEIKDIKWIDIEDIEELFCDSESKKKLMHQLNSFLKKITI